MIDVDDKPRDTTVFPQVLWAMLGQVGCTLKPEIATSLSWLFQWVELEM